MAFLKLIGAFIGALVATVVIVAAVLVVIGVVTILPYIIVLIVIIGLVYVGLFELIKPGNDESDSAD